MQPILRPGGLHAFVPWLGRHTPPLGLMGAFAPNMSPANMRLHQQTAASKPGVASSRELCQRETTGEDADRAARSSASPTERWATSRPAFSRIAR